MTEEIIDIDPTTDPSWIELHETGGGTLFTSAAWLSAVSRTYGFEPRARLVVADGHPLAGIPYCVIDDIRSRRIVCYPFSDFVDPIGDITAAGRASASLHGDRPVRMKIRETRLPDAACSPEQRRDLLWHAIHVDPSLDEDAAFSALNSKVRQNIRRARREGIEIVTRTDLAALRDFYQLHVAVRTRKYGLLPQPFSFFEELHRAFSSRDRLVVMLAIHDAQPIAGIVFIEDGDSLYYKFNASLADDLAARPNELLVWQGIKLAAERKLTSIDLGVSDIDQPGLVRYKRKLAHDECSVVSVTLPPTEHQEPDQVGPVLGELTTLLVNETVPTSATLQGADLLYRYFA